MTKKRGDSSDSDHAAKKKRGGQANNKNAYKHGFYAKNFTEFENKALSKTPVADPSDVIDLMHISTGRFLEAYTASLQDLSYEERLAAFRSISLAAGTIATLMRIQASSGKHIRQVSEIIENLKKQGDVLDEQEK